MARVRVPAVMTRLPAKAPTLRSPPYALRAMSAPSTTSVWPSVMIAMSTAAVGELVSRSV